ncbi:Rap1a/Tai family immunity protein, partial [Dickeya lacustris]
DARSYFHDGNELNQWVEADERTRNGRAMDSDFQDAAMLHGYSIGIFELGEGKIFCSPKTGSLVVGQVSDVVSQYIKTHPEQRNLPAVILTTKALTQAFPCNENQ